jgi:TetR/AcrR family transcriptional repressor of mexJK operon
MLALPRPSDEDLPVAEALERIFRVDVNEEEDSSAEL